MHQTNSTSSSNSAAKSKIHIHLQKDLWESDQNAHHPDYLMIDQVFEHYHQSLKSQPQLLELLIRRKIDPDYVESFCVGFVDRTLGYELQSPKCLLGSRNRGHLQRLGLLNASGHEFLRGSMVFPYRNDNGQIVGAYGRRPCRQRRSPAYHLYWNAQQVTFFSLNEESLPTAITLCKSAIDALTLSTAGIENVVATMGLRGFNDVQLSRLLQDGVQRVYIAFDNTPSGDHYARLVAQALDAIEIRSFRVKLPIGQDVNRYAMTQIDVAAGFNVLLKSAAPFKQHHGHLLPDISTHWETQLETIESGIAFILESYRQAGNSNRTINNLRVHLERFQLYCRIKGIHRLSEVSNDLFMSYKNYLTEERNIFTGNVISKATQMERMNAVVLMLSRLESYGVTQDSIDSVGFGGQPN